MKRMRACSPCWRTAKPGRASALALALGVSQRTVQRALEELAAEGKVQAVRPRPGPPLDGAARAGFPDKLVTPGRAGD